MKEHIVFNKYETDEAGRTFIAPYNVETFGHYECPDCGMTTRGEGVFATGATLPRKEFGLKDYEPFEGECLQNLWNECDCGWNEYS